MGGQEETFFCGQVIPLIVGFLASSTEAGLTSYYWRQDIELDRPMTDPVWQFLYS